MKKLFLFIAIVFIFSCYPKEIKAKESVPKVDAKGAVLMDFETGRILWEKNGDSPFAMASTTKIMTAITAIEKGNLDDTVTVSQRAATAPPTKMKLTKGEKIKLENLLYALMLESANDSAIAISEHIGKTVENFCSYMTQKAKDIGAKDTVFETPNGLDKGNHHSTACDMAKITRYALKNKTFRDIISTPSISFKSDKKSYSVTNKNRLLREYAGATGVKTGFTGKAGHCFVGSAKQNEMELISVVLASGWGKKGKEQKWIDTKNILNYGFQNYEYQIPIKKNQVITKIPIKKSYENEFSVLAKEQIKICIKKDNSEKLRIEKKLPKNITAPVKKGDTIGTLKVYINDTLVGNTDLISNVTINKKTFFDYFKDIVKYSCSEMFDFT